MASQEELRALIDATVARARLRLGLPPVPPLTDRLLHSAVKRQLLQHQAAMARSRALALLATQQLPRPFTRSVAARRKVAWKRPLQLHRFAPLDIPEDPFTLLKLRDFAPLDLPEDPFA
jgi:hypothetical protein